MFAIPEISTSILFEFKISSPLISLLLSRPSNEARRAQSSTFKWVPIDVSPENPFKFSSDSHSSK